MVPIAMPWECPGCRASIRLPLIAADDYVPRPNYVYRCHGCRLDLVLSADRQRMIAAPPGKAPGPLEN
jgi:hypothetical protein